MENYILSKDTIESFRDYLIADEKSTNTIEKYIRDATAFCDFCGGVVTKEIIVSYKQQLSDNGYAASSINSMLAGLNRLFEYLGWSGLKTKYQKIQRQVFCGEEQELTRAEYERLCRTARKKNNERLSLLLQTICGTGIRVSELKYITVDAVRKGEVVVTLKGKTRRILIVRELQKKLLCYISSKKIENGPVFITRSGKTISRTNIWREMKKLCEEAEVNPKKVFPHNLRHLFARVFYSLDRDIAKLADVLGHSSINTTRLYIISTGAEHRKKMEMMRLIL